MTFRSIFGPVYQSFFSGDLYREVAGGWSGNGFGYLFFLVLLCSLPAMILVHREVNRVFEKEAPAILRQIPPVRFQGGRAEATPPGPHVVRNPSDNTPLAIIDTSGGTAALDNTGATYLLTRTQLIVRANPRETRAFDLAGMKDASLDAAEYESIRNMLWTGISVLYFLFIPLFSFVVRAGEACLLGAVGLAVARRRLPGVSYRTMCRLAAVAMTPALVTAALPSLAGAVLPPGSVFDLLLLPPSLGYLFFAIRANAADDRAGGDLSIMA